MAGAAAMGIALEIEAPVSANQGGVSVSSQEASADQASFFCTLRHNLMTLRSAAKGYRPESDFPASRALIAA
jgi:hypothetical protein